MRTTNFTGGVYAPILGSTNYPAACARFSPPRSASIFIGEADGISGGVCTCDALCIDVGSVMQCMTLEESCR